MPKGSLRFLQRVLLIAGLGLVAVAVSSEAYRWGASRLALAAFDRAQSAPAATARPAGQRSGAAENFSDWSEKRIREHKASLSVDKRVPMAVLAIRRLQLRVPVLEGTDDLALNRGAGWIAGTAKPGEDGNVGIAAHRDGFFRTLKNIVVGDAVELETPGRRATYVVDEIEIVDPERVEVLQPRAAPSVTLVTCFPFYYVGDAPQRFIVHARLDETAKKR